MNNNTRVNILQSKSSIPVNSNLKISYHGKTIAQACAEGNVPLTAMLIAEGADAGIDMTQPDENECTLLHYAALGSNIDLIEYVLKKTKKRDIDERNNAGETALLRCAMKGNVGVGRLLLQNGAKLLAVDKKKQLLEEMPLGKERGGCTDTLSRVDEDGHTPMEWACYCGHLPVVRYLLRLGQDPSRKDTTGKSCLHWASIRGQIDVCYYLSRLDVSSSMWEPDTDGISPQQYLHRHEQPMCWDKDILLLPCQQPQHRDKDCSRWLRQRRKRKESGHEEKKDAAEDENEPHISNPTWKVFHDFQEPCIWQMRNSTRLWIVACYALLVCGMWALSFVVPSWAWFIMIFSIGILVWIAQRAVNGSEILKIRKTFSSHFIMDLWYAPEKYCAIWIGILCCFVVYIVLIGLRLSGTTVNDGDEFPGHSLSRGWTNAFTWLEVGLCSSMTISWLMLNLVFVDPGHIKPSCTVFVELSKEVVKVCQHPDISKFCYTCLVRRPLRSKHCRECGFCIARMDHHCIWLNNCVGALNHRPFILFLVFHALASIVWSVLSILAWSREIPNDPGSGGSDACQAVQDIFSTQYFPTLILCILAMLSSVMVVGLLIDQLRNIAHNLTINEKFNLKRYPWLRTPVHGIFFNWYDHGFWYNCMEFCNPWVDRNGNKKKK